MIETAFERSRPFRFGIVAPFMPDLPTWRERVRRIAGHGYSTVLMPDFPQLQPSPAPALAVADIDSIAARLDAMVLLAKSNKISGPIVSAAANRLRQVGANLIGTVLNASSGGTYGYGYGYGYGEREHKPRSKRLAG